MKSLAVLIVFAVSASGCMSLSGLDGSNKFACKAPDGVSCTSVSGVYANPPLAEEASKENGTKTDSGKPDDLAKSAAALPVYSASRYFHAIPSSGTPLLSPPQVLRIWIAPWKDQDGDLRDQSYLYVMWDRGEWNVQHSRDAIRSRYAPVRRLQPTPAAPAAAPATDPKAGAGAPEAGPEVEHVE